MLQLTHIRKTYVTGDFVQTALNDVSVSFRDSEFVAILGPSGSGKTTLLNIIGGLDTYDTGDLVVDGISTKQYKDRDWDTFRNNRIGFVFQAYNLIPHQTILQNVELALTLSGVGRDERTRRAREALESVGLGEHVGKRPNQLSGGQMQRVAIARALINDPEILLADEPTGALDSKTSVQIMDLLTEIAQDRLVIMVTHNPELAEKYATRIVELADGEIRSDTMPYAPTPEEMRLSEKPIRRTRMGFLTALGLSFNNLMTKKGRTIMTAFAGSIGIIGIAGILALANGVNDYIKHVEEETLSVYPLQIMDTGFDLTSMMTTRMGSSAGDAGDAAASADEGGSDDGAADTLHESKMVTSMFEGVKANDLGAFKEYLDSDESHIWDYASSIDYSYNVTPHIFDADTTDGVRQINPNVSFTAMGLGSEQQGNSMMSMMMSTDVFGEMMGDRSMVEGQYDVVAGHWPERYNECMMVVDSSGRIPDVLLYSLGLRDNDELDQMVRQFVNNEEIIVPEGELDVPYEDIMGVKMKLVTAADFYKYDEEHKVWVDKSGDEEYMRALVDAGDDIVIAGVAKARPDSNALALGGGVFYTRQLVDRIIEKSGQTQIVRDQLAQPTIDVFNGVSFADEAEGEGSDFDMSTMFSVDEGAIQAAFKFDTSKLSLDLSSLNVNFDSSSLPAPPPFDPEAMMGGTGGDGSDGAGAPGVPDAGAGVPSIDNSAAVQMAQALVADFQKKVAAGEISLSGGMNAAIAQYLATPSAQAIIGQYLQRVIDMAGMQEQMAQAMRQYVAQYMQGYMTDVMNALTTQMQGIMTSAMTQAMGQLSANMGSAMSFDAEAFKNAFSFNMDEDELQELIMSMMSTEQASFDGNLAKLDYAELGNPSEIEIYARDFDAKQGVIDILDAYNERMEAAGEDAKVIAYTDIVGTMMSSVTTIIDMISYVLIAFVSISLVVSSIMIGVITYISVLERKKEIGILRAIGASKSDISHVFNAETVIEGLIAGLLGVGVTALACIPASAIVYALFDVPNVASLPWQAAAILVAISVFLTFIAGLIPASSASRKDPVEALRSE